MDVTFNSRSLLRIRMRPSSAHFSETNHALAEVSFDAVMNLAGVVSL